jgi:DNA polymerase I
MDFELLPTVSLRPRSFNALTAPREMFIQAMNRNLNLQRFRVLYVTGNSSAILSRLDRRFEALEIRRGFTVFQQMTEYVSHALSDAAKEAAVLLYAPGIDPFFEDLVENADRMFYFEEGPRETPRLAAKAHPRARENQRTLEAYS